MIIQEDYVVFYSEDDQVWRDESRRLHRLGGPAVIQLDGSQEWFLNGLRHRVDGPAITYSDGSEHWYLDGERHRVDGPASIYSDGSESWFKNGKRLTKAEVEG